MPITNQIQNSPSRTYGVGSNAIQTQQQQQQTQNSFNTNGSGPISLQIVNQNLANVSLSNTASKSVSPTFVNVATHYHQHFKQSSDITLDEKLINSTLFNQSSRSRKPFNLTEYETNLNNNNNNNNANQKLNTNTNTSFDDLDAIEVLNLNNNNRSIHSKPFQNPYFYSSQNPQQIISSMYHSQETRRKSTVKERASTRLKGQEKEKKCFGLQCRTAALLFSPFASCKRARVAILSDATRFHKRLTSSKTK